MRPVAAAGGGGGGKLGDVGTWRVQGFTPCLCKQLVSRGKSVPKKFIWL